MDAKKRTIEREREIEQEGIIIFQIKSLKVSAGIHYKPAQYKYLQLLKV